MKARLVLALLAICICVCPARAQQPEQSGPPYTIDQKTADEMLIDKVAPKYPDAVKNGNISGQIVIMFTIDKDGRVSQAMAVPRDFDGRGSRNIDDPKLRQAAVAAVKQRRYRPYLHNGDPVEVDTAVVLPFDFTKTGASSHADAQDSPASGAAQRGAPLKGVFGGLVLDPKLLEEKLINRVEPEYPQMARSARIQGDVTFAVLIDKQGHVSKLRAVQGHPILIQAGMDAVKHWEYIPFLLNGETVEVESTVLVKFRL
jgi:TonB family protein